MHAVALHCFKLVALVVMTPWWGVQQNPGNREVVLAAVREWGYALKHAAEPLRADREVVRAAVQQSGLALMDAAAPLQADE